MDRKALWGGLGGALAALLSWTLSYPFLPVKMVDLSTVMEQPTSNIEEYFTLGTFYGWFNSALFGALAGLLIVWVYTRDRNDKAKAFRLAMATVLCCVLVEAGDALSDLIGIRIYSTSVVNGFVVSFIWSVFLGIAICTALYVSLGVKPALLKRWIFAICICAVAAFVLRFAADFLVALALVPYVLSHKGGPINAWALSAPGFLAAKLAIGISAGVCWSLSERMTRGAWLTFPVGRGEGYSWTLDDLSTGIGSQEGLTVRLTPVQSLAPYHAAIQRHSDRYAIHDAGSGLRTYLNGYMVQSEWLQQGDRIQVGPYCLIFHLRKPGVGSAMNASAMQTEDAASLPETPAMTQSRLVDDFGTEYPLSATVSVVGRDPSCDVVLRWDRTVSRRHAQITYSPTGYQIEDLDSRNGTRLNGNEVVGPTPLKNGDLIELCQVRLTFRT